MYLLYFLREGIILLDWLHRMNSAINYIEANLAGDIDLGVAARAACCSEYLFRMVSKLRL